MEEVTRFQLDRVPKGPAGWWAHGRILAGLAGSAVAAWTTVIAAGLSTGADRWTAGLGLDLRFLSRSLRRSPGYAVTVVVVLAAAVAVTASVFSFVQGTLLAEPPYPNSDRVVVAWGSNPTNGQLRDVVSGPNFVDLRDRTTTLEALAALHGDDRVLIEDGRQRAIGVNEVSSEFFSAVRIQPFLGRLFDGRERSPQNGTNILVSHGFWQTELAGDPGVVGSTLALNGIPHTVIGVLPPDFQFLAPAPVWAPLTEEALTSRERYNIHFHLIGLLRPDATPEAATRELTAITEDIAVEYPGFEGWTVLVERLHAASVMSVRPIVWTSAAAVILVLLVALVNLATLFRIRTLQRDEEITVRAALGSGRRRIVRILGMEAVTLSLVGAAIGLLVAPSLLSRIVDLIPLWITIPESAAQVQALRARLDPRVAGTTVVLAALGSLVLTAPALLSAARRRAAPGRSSRIHGSRGTNWLVAVELALATVLVLGAGLLVRSADRMLATDVGVDDQGLLTLWVGNVWEWPIPDQVLYFQQLVDRVEAMPGVESAGIIDYPPFLGEDDYARVYFLDSTGDPVRDLREEWRRVDGGVMSTLGFRMLQGRPIGDGDLVGTPSVAVVNESFARKHYPAGDALGSRVSTHNGAYRDLEIVGIIADVRSHGPQTPAQPILYVPQQGDPRGTVGLMVRVRGGDPMALAPAVQDEIWTLDPTQPAAYPAAVSDLVGQWVAVPRAVRTLVSGLALFSILLAALGVFGVVGFAVQSRTTEMGLRLALGASPGRLRSDILMGTAPLVGLGVLAGLILGLGAARFARSLLYGVGPSDPVAAAGAIAIMATAALLATWLPARRASRIDPSEAMRTE
jgi:predicted permease